MNPDHALVEKLRQTKLLFPWYESLISSSAGTGVLPHSARLAELPLMTAEVLEKHYYAADEPFAGRTDIYCYKTSGTSSGRRKSIYYSAEDEARYLAIKLNVVSAILSDARLTRAMADMGTGHAAATAEAVFRQLGMETESIPFQLPIERHVERLAAFRPEVLYTMPSILDRILMASPDPIQYGIRKIILVGEAAPPAWQQRAAERLGIRPGDITDTYGSIEIGTIASYDHALGRYVLTEGLIAEGLRAEEAGVGEAELGPDERILVLTSTVRDLFPAIRFVTYDVVRDFESIVVNGETRASFKSLVKRVGNELKHGEKISVYDIEDAVYRHIRDAAIRVVAKDNALTVHILGETVAPDALDAIKQEIAGRIPEIGVMIQGGMLQEIRVIAGAFDDTVHRQAIKGKKIHKA
ncbi:CoF synthetase [Paenibacillus methanolicus]|uniref:Cysteine synthase A/phenylacetate-CoA ligase n=1 Tax=Paenibacillus methanolicus TaxID=582686 RepID=A0A5S5CB63_9BACL|nr:CoF synthetase [Paenibacillus methanolicus]TYP76621.1 cysteine synthase A/phenylacetate-CoA ligase [Paenibacillus methanolicus]